LTRSRCARDLNTMYENTTASPELIFTCRGNGTPILTVISQSRLSYASAKKEELSEFLN
jgi:hypothetical protein